MIILVFIVLFFWISLTIARGVLATPLGFLLIIAALAYVFGIWILVGVIFAAVTLGWLALHGPPTD